MDTLAAIKADLESWLRHIVRTEIEKVLANKTPARLQYTIDEAASALGVTKSWLGERVRAGDLPHHRMAQSRRVYFTQQDLDQILEGAAKTGTGGC